MIEKCSGRKGSHKKIGKLFIHLLSYCDDGHGAWTYGETYYKCMLDIYNDTLLCKYCNK